MGKLALLAEMYKIGSRKNYQLTSSTGRRNAADRNQQTLTSIGCITGITTGWTDIPEKFKENQATYVCPTTSVAFLTATVSNA